MAKNKKIVTRKIPVIKIEDKKEGQPDDQKQDLHPAIAKIFEEEKGASKDLTKLEKKKTNRKSLYFKIIGVLLLLFAVSFAGFMIFFRDTKFKEKDVSLEFSGSSNVASGDEITITINYLNQGRAFLGNMELSLTYPEGFTFKSSEPEPDNVYHQYFQLGNLGAGKAGQVKVTGQIIGEVDTSKVFTAKLSYKPSNFNSVFETNATFSVNINSSIIGLEIEGLKQVIPDKEASYKLKYNNTSRDALENIRIEAVYPDGFTYKSADPAPYEGNNLWKIERLEANGTGEINLAGVFSGQAGDMKELKVKVGLITSGSEVKPQMEKSALILLISPELTLSLKINGQDEEIAADLGDTLTYYLQYKNNSDIEINDVTLRLEIEGQAIDMDTLDDESQGKMEGQAISWTKSEIDKLASLKPDDEGELTFKIDLKDQLVLAGSEDQNFSVKNVFKANSSSLQDLGQTSLEVSSNTVTVKINSQARITCEARYYSEENEKLGEGPLPPEVGKTTSYRVYFILSNSSNKITDVKVKTTLPEDIFWTGKNKSVSSGTMNFDPAKRQVTWQIDEVSVGTGQVFPSLMASFEVSTTPVAADIGLYKVLTDKTELTATDSYTRAALKSDCDSMTTELPNDINAIGKGLVVEAQP